MEVAAAASSIVSILTGAWRGRNRLLVVAPAQGRLLAPDPDDSSRLHGNAPGDPVSRPALDIPGRRAAGVPDALPARAAPLTRVSCNILKAEAAWPD
jgi:hypothetical protein